LEKSVQTKGQRLDGQKFKWDKRQEKRPVRYDDLVGPKSRKAENYSYRRTGSTGFRGGGLWDTPVRGIGESVWRKGARAELVSAKRKRERGKNHGEKKNLQRGERHGRVREWILA